MTQAKTPGDFQISLAQWSLHRTFFGGAIEDWQAFGRTLMESPDSVLKGDVDPIDFPVIAAGYGVDSIESVNTLYEGRQLSEDEGIKATKALLEKVFRELQHR